VLEDKLYSGIISIVDYLRSRPEILVALDWIKIGRLDLGKEVSSRLYRTIKEIKIEALQSFDQHFPVRIAEWVLFMIVNTLALWPHSPHTRESIVWAKNAAEIPNENFRTLYRFIALGLEGLN
jgi:hypothetical protein